MKNNKIKVDHSILKGLLKQLEKISRLDEVSMISPGEIKPGKTKFPDTYIKVQNQNKISLRCLGFAENAIQELYIVASNYDKVRSLIKYLNEQL